MLVMPATGNDRPMNTSFMRDQHNVLDLALWLRVLIPKLIRYQCISCELIGLRLCAIGSADVEVIQDDGVVSA